MNGVKDNIEQKISNIKNSYALIEKQFAKIQKLIFGILANTLQEEVVSNLENIDSNIDAIFLKDLAMLENITLLYLPEEFAAISRLIETVVNSYRQFKVTKDNLKNNLIASISKVTDFINDKLV